MQRKKARGLSASKDKLLGKSEEEEKEKEPGIQEKTVREKVFKSRKPMESIRDWENFQNWAREIWIKIRGYSNLASNISVEDWRLILASKYC